LRLKLTLARLLLEPSRAGLSFDESQIAAAQHTLEAVESGEL